MVLPIRYREKTSAFGDSSLINITMNGPSDAWFFTTSGITKPTELESTLNVTTDTAVYF